MQQQVVTPSLGSTCHWLGAMPGIALGDRSQCALPPLWHIKQLQLDICQL